MTRERTLRNHLCAYCGAKEATTEDHVVPVCLFNRPLPPDIVKVPACNDCNHAKSKNDDYLRDMLVIDIHCSHHPVAQALMDGKMKRAMQNNHSKVARAAVKSGGLKPMYSPGGVYLGHCHSVPLEWDRVNEIFKTMASGLYFNLRGHRFPDGYSFEVLHLDSRYAQQLIDLMKANGANGPYFLGQVFACLFILTKDPGITMWLMQFYGGMYITVITRPVTTSDIIHLPGSLASNAAILETIQ
jgi:hypothetical protein